MPPTLGAHWLSSTDSLHHRPKSPAPDRLALDRAGLARYITTVYSPRFNTSHPDHVDVKKDQNLLNLELIYEMIFLWLSPKADVLVREMHHQAT